MPLRLVTGRAGSGKTLLCLGEIKERLTSADGFLFYLVPEQSNLEAEQSLFAHTGAEGLSNAAVLTFRRLSHRVFTELGKINRNYINGAGKKIRIASIVESHGDSLAYFANQSRTAGFIDDLASMFAEFKQIKLTAAKLSELAGAASDPSFSQKLAELSLLYKSYCEEIENGYLDTDDDLTRLAALLSESAAIKNAEFWVDGFYGFTEQEYDIICELVKYAKNVTVCLCCENPFKSPPSRQSRFAPVTETALELRERAGKITADIQYRHIGMPVSAKNARAELLHLERHLFRRMSGVYGGVNEAVFLRECADIHEEAEYAAARIRALCRERGYRYGDAAVICSEPETYAPLIKPVFERHGLRCYVDIKKDITDHPLIRMILSLFAIVESGFAFEPVFLYLKSGLTDISADEAIRLENFALARGICGNLWKEARIWRPGSVDFNLAELDGVRTRFLKPVTKFIDTVRVRRTPADFCAALYAFLGECGARQKIERLLRTADQTPEGKSQSSEWKQIWDFTVAILDQIAETGGAYAAETGAGANADSRQLYFRMFECGAASYKVGAIPPSADEILIGSADRTRSRKVKALFVLGVNEGMFPGITKPASLLSDENRVELRAAGVRVSKDAAASSYDAQFRAYKTLTTATESLYLSWPAALSGGKAVKPSYVTKIIKKMFGINGETTGAATDSGSDGNAYPAERAYSDGSADSAKKADSDGSADPAKRADSDGSADLADKADSVEVALEGLVSQLRESGADARRLPPQWSAVYDWFMGSAAGAARLASLLPSFGYRANRARFGGPAAETLSDLSGISVSRLERYAACPFSYLCTYVVAARPRSEYKIEAPDIGTFTHAAIEKAAQKITDGGAWDGMRFEQCARHIDDAVEYLLAQDDYGAFTANFRNIRLKDRIKKIAAWSLFAIARHVNAGTYKPWRYEMSFEYGLRPPDGQSRKAVTLRGVIDRVDIADADGDIYVRVVDLKTGRKKLAVNDIVNGLSLQLPVYLDAAINAVAEGTAGTSTPANRRTLPGGLFYFELSQPYMDMRKSGRSGIGANESETDEQLLDMMTMGGYPIGDEEAYKKTYENNIIENSSSKIISGVSIRRDGRFRATVFSPGADEYELIRRAAAASIQNICDGIYGGVYNVSPYKKPDASPCAYCQYRGACGIDIIRQDAAFRTIQKKSDKAQMIILKNMPPQAPGPAPASLPDNSPPSGSSVS